MKSKIWYLVIAAFIAFWVGLIGWGMFKTGFKLLREKTSSAAATKAKGKEEGAAKQKKSEETTPVPTPVQAEARPIPVRTFKVKATDFQDLLPVMGTVKGKTEIELKFEISGVIQKIYFREGEKIKKADLIASIDPKDGELRANYARNKFKSTQAAYNSVQKKLEITRSLYEAGAIIKSKLEEAELESESAKFQVETARSEMELAENELKKTSLYAAREGVMGRREAEESEFITPQDKVGSLLEISEVLIEVGVVERDIEKIKLGQKARVYVDAYPNFTFEGSVDNIFPVVEGKSRTLTVKIKVPNPNGLLLPGMFSRAEIFICELKGAFVVPSVALIRTGGVVLVPVIPAQSIKKDEEGAQVGIVQLRKVNLGYVTTDYAQIIEGLNEEDLVVTETQGELKDNAKVKIVGMEEASFGTGSGGTQ